MNCKKAETFLVEYLYQELSASKTVELESHLQTCDGCTKLLRNWKEIHQGFQESVVAPQAPPFLKQRILSHARTELERKPSFGERVFVFLRPALLVPAALIAVFALLLYSPMSKRAMVAQAPQSTAAPKPVAMKTAPRDGYLKMESKSKADDYSGDRKRLEYEQRESGEAKQYAEDLHKKQPAVTDEVDQAVSNSTVYAKKSTDALADKDIEAQRVQEGKLQKNEPAGGGMAASPAPEPPASVPEVAQNEPPKEAAAQPIVQQKMKINETALDEESNNKNVASNYRQAQEYFREDQMKSGVKSAQVAIDLDKNKELAAQFYNDGVLYQNHKEYAKAIVNYKMLVNNYQTYRELNDVLLRLGECYAAIGKVDDARMIFEQLLKSNPNNKMLHEKLTALERQKKDTEALRSLGYVDQN